MNNEERMRIIADNITNYRKSKGITQKELAAAVGVSQSTMTDYMKLRTAPSWSVIQNLADYFGVKKSDIDTTFKPKHLIENTIIAETIEIMKKLDETSQTKILAFARFEYQEAEIAAKSKDKHVTAS